MREKVSGKARLYGTLLGLFLFAILNSGKHFRHEHPQSMAMERTDPFSKHTSITENREEKLKLKRLKTVVRVGITVSAGGSR